MLCVWSYQLGGIPTWSGTHVPPKQDKALCGGSAQCGGFTFRDFDERPPADRTIAVAFKTTSGTQLVPERVQGLQVRAVPSRC